MTCAKGPTDRFSAQLARDLIRDAHGTTSLQFDAALQIRTIEFHSNLVPNLRHQACFGRWKVGGEGSASYIRTSTQVVPRFQLHIAQAFGDRTT